MVIWLAINAEWFAISHRNNRTCFYYIISNGLLNRPYEQLTDWQAVIVFYFFFFYKYMLYGYCKHLDWAYEYHLRGCGFKKLARIRIIVTSIVSLVFAGTLGVTNRSNKLLIIAVSKCRLILLQLATFVIAFLTRELIFVYLRSKSMSGYMEHVLQNIVSLIIEILISMLFGGKSRQLFMETKTLARNTYPVIFQLLKHL